VSTSAKRHFRELASFVLNSPQKAFFNATARPVIVKEETLSAEVAPTGGEKCPSTEEQSAHLAFRQIVVHEFPPKLTRIPYVCTFIIANTANTSAAPPDQR
jgi:hypothetical protein